MRRRTNHRGTDKTKSSYVHEGLEQPDVVEAQGGDVGLQEAILVHNVHLLRPASNITKPARGLIIPGTYRLTRK